MVNDLNHEKSELQDRVDRLEAAKGRMERILKQTSAQGRSLKRTANGELDSAELIDEL